jgi:hypothetical protein
MTAQASEDFRLGGVDETPPGGNTAQDLDLMEVE